MQFFKIRNRISDTEQTVQVTALSNRCGSASQATLYQKMPVQLYRATHAHRVAGSGRPTKKQRRHVSRFIRKDS